jgi:hypothetical protein
MNDFAQIEIGTMSLTQMAEIGCVKWHWRDFD